MSGAKANRSAESADTPMANSSTRPSTLPAVPTWGEGDNIIYLGLLAPDATQVSVVGPFNGWQPGCYALARSAAGWWEGLLCLPPGCHAYRFWVEGGPFGAGDWLPDPEQPERIESGYDLGHSLIRLPESAP